MYKQFRPDPPKILSDNWQQWGKDYVAKLKASPKYRFVWRKKVNQQIIPLLEQMTQSHCS